MLRCKEGDTAVIANLQPDQAGYEYLGTFVTCGPYEASPLRGNVCWRLLKPSQPLIMDDGVTHYTHAPDWCLDPIRGVSPALDTDEGIEKKALLPA